MAFKISDYTDFLELLTDKLYETSGAVRIRHTTCTPHYIQMFKKLPTREAHELLDLAIKYDEFHPDSVALFRKVILGAVKESEPEIMTVTICGESFKVVYVTTSVEHANEYCLHHPEAGVIKTIKDTRPSGKEIEIILIANTKSERFKK